MKLIAIDPSLTSTGYAYTSRRMADAKVGVIDPKPLKGAERIEFIRITILRLVEDVSPSLVVYEGYSMGRFQTGRHWDRAELGGVLKNIMFRAGIPVMVVPPTTLKLFATGSGSSKIQKHQVRQAMSAVRGRLFSSSDEADAYALLNIGAAYVTGIQAIHPTLRGRAARAIEASSFE